MNPASDYFRSVRPILTARLPPRTVDSVALSIEPLMDAILARGADASNVPEVLDAFANTGLVPAEAMADIAAATHRFLATPAVEVEGEAEAVFSPENVSLFVRLARALASALLSLLRPKKKKKKKKKKRVQA